MLVENRDFFYTPLHSTAPLPGLSSTYCREVWYGKTRMVWLPEGEKGLKIGLFISTESTKVTDGHTQTPHDG